MPVFGCRQVLGVFNGREWGHIDSHLQEMLGRHAAETADFEAAASHFAATLACTEAHPNRQRQLLEQFLSTLRRLTPEQAPHHADWKPSCLSITCNPKDCASKANMPVKLADGAECCLCRSRGWPTSCPCLQWIWDTWTSLQTMLSPLQMPMLGHTPKRSGNVLRRLYWQVSSCCGRFFSCKYPKSDLPPSCMLGPRERACSCQCMSLAAQINSTSRRARYSCSYMA